MNMQNKLKTRGILMQIGFAAVLAIIFSPVFPEKMNGLDFMDNLFNMVSKGSSYFIPAALEDSEQYAGRIIDVTITMKDEKEAAATSVLLQKSGVAVSTTGSRLRVRGDMSTILKSSLGDSDLMFANNSDAVQQKYGFGAELALFTWWNSFQAIGAALNK